MTLDGAETSGTHGRGRRLASSVVVGVHNVLLQCCIFIKVGRSVCVCVLETRALRSRALLAQAQQRWRRAFRGEHSQPRFAAVFLTRCPLWLPLYLFSEGTFN